MVTLVHFQLLDFGRHIKVIYVCSATQMEQIAINIRSETIIDKSIITILYYSIDKDDYKLKQNTKKR